MKNITAILLLTAAASANAATTIIHAGTLLAVPGEEPLSRQGRCRRKPPEPGQAEVLD